MVLHIYAERSLDNLNPRFREYAETLGAGRRLTLWAVVLPGVLPELFGGFRTALGAAWGLATIAELLGALPRRRPGHHRYLGGLRHRRHDGRHSDAGLDRDSAGLDRHDAAPVGHPMGRHPRGCTMNGLPVSVEHASCRFSHASGAVVQALDDVSLQMASSEFVCLLGRSGHGKSTLLRSIAGLNALTGGITVGGDPVEGPSAERGMVFQEDTVFPWMRVQENVEFGLRAQGKMPHPVRKQRGDGWRRSA